MAKQLLDFSLLFFGPIFKAGDKVVKGLQKDGTIFFERERMLERPRVKDKSDNLNCRELVMIIIRRLANRPMKGAELHLFMRRNCMVFDMWRSSLYLTLSD